MSCTGARVRQPDPGRVLVVGGGGFLGRHVCTAFASAGHTVLIAAPRNARSPWGRTIRVDILDVAPAELTGVLLDERIGVVVNAAGGVWGIGEQEMRLRNVVLVDRLVSALSLLPWRCRLVQLGSVHEYGAVRPGESVDERAPTRPLTPYGHTKLLGSESVLTATQAGRVNGVVLRASNVIGAGISPLSLLGQVVDQLIVTAGTPDAIVSLPPLRGVRDFVDARDFADAVTAAAAAPVTGQAINVGSGRAVGVRRLVTQLIEVSSVRARVLERDRGAAMGASARGGAVDWQQVDIRAAKRLLGWEPRRELIDSLLSVWHARYERVTVPNDLLR
jgi:nucleoside-diphosphate-sugar epimerase